MGSCMSIEQLECLLDERLDDRQQQAAEDHVEGCANCQQTLEELAVAQNVARIRSRLKLDPVQGAPEAGFLRSIKDQGPPIDLGPRDDDAISSDRLDTARSSSHETEPAAGQRPMPTIAGFRIIREIGRGGMGVIYEAVELALGRRAALKVLLSQHESVTGVERFHREARAAAKLHHTHIVPVFGVGEDLGRLYYVMQLIESESLDQVFNRLSRTAADALRIAAIPSTDGCNPVNFRSIARIGRQVAEALAYAHKQGVIHRDIKPANLLLDALGNVWVTDFGLAKAFEGEDGLTQTGDFVGTVRFMAPERFDGRSELRSDVYALGATLYELLTLRTLFAESNRTKLIERILHDQPVRPRQIDRRIPRNLETIIQKATAKEPEARYVSAAALAEDLRRFLGDEPVLAQPIGLVARLTRWCRRQPRLATAIGLAAASLMLATGLSFALAWSQYRAASRLRTEQALTLVEKTRAEENFRDAQQAVEDYLMRVSDETLAKQQDSSEVRQLRKRLLEDALKYYQRFIARQGNDPRLLANLAYAQASIAGISTEIGSGLESVSEYQQAASIWERIVRDSPTDSHARIELAACLFAVAEGKAHLGLHDESFRAFEQSLAILTPFVRANPADSDTQRLLGATLTGYGHEQERVGHTTAALRSFHEAVLILEAPVRSNPSDAHSYRKFAAVRPGRLIVVQRQRDLAAAYRGLGVAQQSAGQRAPALHSLEKALTLFRALIRDYPTAIDNNGILATQISTVGLLLDELGQTTAALRYHQEALAIFDTRLRHLSNDAGVKAERADTINWIAALEHKLGRIPDSIRSHEQARDVIRILVSDHPQVVRYRRALCIGDKGLAGLYRKIGRWDEAIALLDEAQAILEPLARTWPTFHYHTACCLALRTPPASPSGTSLAVEDSQHYGDRAMAELRQAAAGGIKPLQDYRTDPNLDPLRGREDFQALLMDIAFPFDPLEP
jgi:eukaryotic-like serine/threonine-protein kinase